MDELFNMKIGETLDVGGPDYVRIYRVPGGWIYNFASDCGGGFSLSSCFVPFCNDVESLPHTYKGGKQ